MKTSNSDFKNSKDKIEGKIKEVAGEITGNEQLELKGKLQMAKADIKEKMNLKDNVNDAKEHMAKKVNDTLDKKGKK